MSAVHFDVDRPARYQPIQLLIRLLLMALLGIIGAPLGWVFGVLYLGLPLVAAIAIATRGPDRYHADLAPLLTRGLRWLLAVYAYLALLTDRLPLAEREMAVRFEVTPGGTPTVGRALLHLITSIPAALILWVLAIVSAVLWVIAAVFILVRRTYPDGIFGFQRGLVRLWARLLAHQASLVEGAAPIDLDTGAEPVEPQHDAPAGPGPS